MCYLTAVVKLINQTHIQFNQAGLSNQAETMGIF